MIRKHAGVVDHGIDAPRRRHLAPQPLDRQPHRSDPLAPDCGPRPPGCAAFSRLPRARRGSAASRQRRGRARARLMAAPMPPEAPVTSTWVMSRFLCWRADFRRGLRHNSLSANAAASVNLGHEHEPRGARIGARTQAGRIRSQGLASTPAPARASCSATPLQAAGANGSVTARGMCRSTRSGRAGRLSSAVPAAAVLGQFAAIRPATSSVASRYANAVRPGIPATPAATRARSHPRSGRRRRASGHPAHRCVCRR